MWKLYPCRMFVHHGGYPSIGSSPSILDSSGMLKRKCLACTDLVTPYFYMTTETNCILKKNGRQQNQSFISRNHPNWNVWNKLFMLCQMCLCACIERKKEKKSYTIHKIANQMNFDFLVRPSNRTAQYWISATQMN